MKITSYVFYALLICLVFSTQVQSAEDQSGCLSDQETPAILNNIANTEEISQLKEIFCAKSISNELIKRTLSDKELKLGGLTLGLKVFESDSAPNFGIEYDYSISKTFGVSKTENINPGFYNFGSIDFQSNGTFAFEDSNNPLNMIDTKISLTANWGYFGGNPLKNKDEFENLVGKAFSEFRNTNGVSFIKVAEEVIGENPLIDYIDALGLTFTTSASADIGYETDQSFNASQLTYGGSIYASLIDYRQDSNLKWFNFIDYPAAIVRFMTGLDPDLSPRGTQFPFLRFAVAQVDPNDEAPRVLLARDTSNYTRINFEASYSAPLFKLPDLGIDALKKFANDTVFLTGNYRYYRELSPSAAVRAAGLIDQRLWTVSLTGLFGGMYVSYSNGELPLDVDRDNVVELGFKTHF